MVARIATQGEPAGVAWGRAVVAALGLLLAVRLAALFANATDLFFDEAQYWSWSLEPAFGYYSKPPLIAWLIRLATQACGAGELCVRLPSPVMHTGTALLIYAIATHLYDARTGFWSALVFATLPGVSLSAGIISTDVPLLFFWALALYAFVRLLDSGRWWPTFLLGAALGLGLNAKYAMAYFVLCAGVFFLLNPERRAVLRDARLHAALLIGVALIAPNILWNAHNGFATFSHTADNARWTGSLVNPAHALEFLGAQLGVFGPILFPALLAIAARAWRRGLPAPDRLLLAFALPVLLIITGQAFLSRAHANWAAVSYVSASALVTATLIRDASWGWLRASTALHIALAALIGLATAAAGTFRLPGVGDPFTRTLGWRALAEETAATLAEGRRSGTPFGAVMAEDRAVTAELIYYLRQEAVPVLTWREHGKPRDHYELTRPFTKNSPEPVLLVSLKRSPGAARGLFARAEQVREREVPAGSGGGRRATFYRLEGYHGE